MGGPKLLYVAEKKVGLCEDLHPQPICAGNCEEVRKQKDAYHACCYQMRAIQLPQTRTSFTMGVVHIELH